MDRGLRHPGWTAALAVAAILAIEAGLAYGLGRLAEDRFVHREAQVAQEFFTSMVVAEASADRLFDKPAPSPQLRSFSTHVRSLPGIIRANIYSPDGFIRYSTESQLTGLKFSDNPELEEAFAGRLGALLVQASDDQKGEHLAIAAPPGELLLEAYAPIPDASGRTIAVVELYKSPKPLEDAIAEVRRAIWLASGAAGLLLIAAFLALRRRPAG